MSTTDKQFSLYIKPSDIEEHAINKENPSVSYLIFQNNELLRKYEAISNEIETLQSSHDELEEDIDKMQKSKVFLQGLAKNSHILKKYQVIIATHYKNTNKLMNYFIIFINVLSIGQLICLVYNINPIVFFIIQLSSTCLFYKQFIMQTPENVKYAIIDYESLEKASDHIMDLIDES